MLPAIFALEGPIITPSEARLFQQAQPLGFILFGRNIECPEQVTALTSDLKSLLGRDCPILIDQEGGRVQRLKPPHWPKWPAAGDYDDLEKLRTDMSALAKMLFSLGINVNCAPVLDLRFDVETDIIGDRAYSTDPAHVIQAGQIVCDAFMQAGVTPVIKHLPGHGRARADTHFKEARIDASLAELRRSDFIPFQHVKAPWGMIAHVILTAVDTLPVTLSPTAIGDIIRGEIGFEGILISDDLSMKALSAHGNIGEVALKCLQAGCDIALYCDGKLKDMEEIAKILPQMDDSLLKRLGDFAPINMHE
tara:strand:+ start:166907 stop:167827 length:921 start_codon:yes stop_codon:yes gene_type:complete